MKQQQAILLVLLLATSCGPELKLETRATMAPDDITQSYQIMVYANATGASNFTANAVFSTLEGPKATTTELFTGDTLTLNGVAMSVTGGIYSTSGTGNESTYEFVWTHGETTYKNTATVTLYPPSPEPSYAGKSSGLTIQVSDVPSSVYVQSTLNAGTRIATPFINIPVEVTGGGTTPSVTGNFGGLADGPGVLTLLETASTELTAPTSGGGSLTTMVQFGYNVTIGD